MTMISLAPEWAAMRSTERAAARQPDAPAAPAAANAEATVDVAVRQLRPGAFEAYVPAAVRQDEQHAGVERLRQTTWIRPADAPPAGSALDVKV